MPNPLDLKPDTLQEGEVVRLVLHTDDVDMDGLYRVVSEPSESPDGAVRYWLEPVDEFLARYGDAQNPPPALMPREEER